MSWWSGFGRCRTAWPRTQQRPSAGGHGRLLATCCGTSRHIRLDIGTDEIQVGVHSVRQPDGSVTGQLFIADTLQNGAGYATWVADRVPELIQRAQDLAGQWSGHATSGGTPCDASCYECLRDYGNSPWHSLLDWRLSRDMLALLAGDAVDLDGEADWTGRLAERVATETNLTVDFVGKVPVLRHGTNALAVLHPLESPTSPNPGSRVERVRRTYPGVFTSTMFELVRRPLAVAVRLL